MAVIVARSTSTLPQADKVSADSLVEFSQKNGNYFDTMSIKYSDLFNQISAGTDLGIASKYGMSGLNARQYANKVDNILGNSANPESTPTTFWGTKTFKNGVVLNSPGLMDVNAVNRGQVKELINQCGHRTSSLTASGGFPLDIDEFPVYPPNEGEEDKFIRLQVDMENEKLDDTTTAVIKDSGHLVMWGWLADTGVVQPEMAWVGLFAKMSAYGNRWLPLQIKPWILGKYSTILQYVSFDLPVSGPIEVKVRTGFRMNVNQGGFQNKGSKTYKVNSPCSFFGYVLKS